LARLVERGESLETVAGRFACRQECGGTKELTAIVDNVIVIAVEPEKAFLRMGVCPGDLFIFTIAIDIKGNTGMGAVKPDGVAIEIQDQR